MGGLSSIIYCSLSFYFLCIDLLMMYDRPICANCNFRWEHFPLSQFIAGVIYKVRGHSIGAWSSSLYDAVIISRTRGWRATWGEGTDNKKTFSKQSPLIRRVCLMLYWKWYQKIQMNHPDSGVFQTLCVQNFTSDLIPRRNTVCHQAAVYFQELNSVMWRS